MTKTVKYWVRNASGNMMQESYIKRKLWERIDLKNPSRFNKEIFNCDIDRLRRENSNLAL